MKTRHSPMSEDRRDEALGSLLRSAAERLAPEAEPDFRGLYELSREPKMRAALPRKAGIALPLAAAAALALTFGLLLQRASASGYATDALLYSREISQLAHGIVGFHSRPLFSGAATVSAPLASDEAIPTAPSGELRNFVDDLWNREGS